jgi:hypothetical protein
MVNALADLTMVVNDFYNLLQNAGGHELRNCAST